MKENLSNSDTICRKIARKVWNEFCKTSHNLFNSAFQTVKLVYTRNKRRGKVYDEGDLCKCNEVFDVPHGVHKSKPCS